MPQHPRPGPPRPLFPWRRRKGPPILRTQFLGVVEYVVDAGTNTLVIDNAGSTWLRIGPPGVDPVQHGRMTGRTRPVRMFDGPPLLVVQRFDNYGTAAAGDITDAGTDTFALVQTGVDALVDLATNIVVLVQTGADALSDLATVTVILAPSGVESEVDGATVAFSLTPSGADALTDAGTVTEILLPSGDDVPLDSGTNTFILSLSGLDALADAGTGLFVHLGGADEILADGTSVLSAFVGSGEEALADLASIVLEALVAGQDDLADSGTALMEMLLSGTGTPDEVTDGTIAFELVGSGAHQAPNEPPHSSPLYGFPQRPLWSRHRRSY